MKIIATNNKVKYEYFIIKKYEAGIVLLGSEVKSIRKNNISIKESFVKIIKGEVFLFNCNISKLIEQNSFKDISETRERKLLLNKKEIKKLEKEINIKGKTIIPLKIYINENNIIKIEIALAIGKKLYDKREDIKKRDLERRN
jgi:SsrA-binding protein